MARHLGTVKIDRRTLLAAACLSPIASARASAGGSARFWVNVNLQGLEGGGVVPGREGTDYFAPRGEDLSYLTARTTGPSRLPFRWERIQHEPGGSLDETYLGEIASVADTASRAGRGVILDCHNYMRRSVEGAERIVGADDGALTARHLADLWRRIAAALGGHPGVAGFDIMNEPHDLPAGCDLASTMQLCVDAISTAETRKAIYVEGDRWSSAEHWVAANPGYPLRDAHDRITYSAHCYADADASGTHFEYGALVEAGISDTVLADRSREFAAWCTRRNVRGHIGETNVGTDDRRWLRVLENGLAFWQRSDLPVNLWLFAENFGANPFNLYPIGGAEAPQWPVIARHLAA